MKYLWVFLIVFILLVSCSGDNIVSGTHAVKEWVSPDGVHYWVSHYNHLWGNFFGMAPRYDSSGNLVISEAEE